MPTLLFIKNFFLELKRRSPVFFYLGFGFSTLFLVMLICFTLCNFALFEICNWLKPSKFTLSLAAYVFSLGWYLEYLKSTAGNKQIKILTWLIAVCVTLEMVMILLQSWASSDAYRQLGISSVTTERLSKVLFMGGNLFIVANTIVVVYICALFFRKIPLEPASYLWSIRAAFVVFILSGFIGGFLLRHFAPTQPNPHSLGLPFAHFSSLFDNLVSLHFLGIHYLQLLPFICYYFPQHLGRGFIVANVIVFANVSGALMLKVIL